MRLSTCPVCKGKLQIKECFCPACSLTLKGDFEQSGLSNLNLEQLDFVRLFIIVQGNIKEMEKRLNISYPTVKNRLAEIIAALGSKPEKQEDFADIFHDLDEGFVSVEQALSMIEARKGSKQ
jgi:hypothetical protein